tara:strand:- start:192 stop:395 length:204 start_codon:yes stop_codon:yes gene_type:complete
LNPKQLRRHILSQGFIPISEKRHYKYKHVETGGLLIVAKTPSDTNHHKQVLRDMEKIKKGTRPCDRK